MNENESVPSWRHGDAAMVVSKTQVVAAVGYAELCGVRQIVHA